jgi:acetyl esterase/lipase
MANFQYAEQKPDAKRDERPLDHPDSDMKLVLDKLAGLGGKPIETLTPEEARQQPTPADAVMAILRERHQHAPLSLGVETRDLTIEGAAGNLPARLYRPEKNEKGDLPLVVYFHGGGWVIADINVYDAAPRAIAKFANCAVLSCHYRQAPEHKFPAAHEDAFAAWRWALANADSLGADAKKIAVMGESAGGNLAINVAIQARDEGVQAPAHMVSIYPVAGAEVNSASYQANASAKPLSKPMMAWFIRHVFASPDQPKQDPRINLIDRTNLAGLPSATIIRAEIDPLAEEGELLARKLKDPGVDVRGDTYKGVAHEFFGMGLVVKDAAIAESFVAHELKRALVTAILPI